MLKPDPRVWGGKWVVDLRAAGFGQRYRLGDEDSMDREGAIYAAFDLLGKLRGERMAEVGQRDLFEEKSPGDFPAAIDRWEAQKVYVTEGGAEWGKKYAKVVRRELADYKLAEFAPPMGTARMAGYADELKRRGLSGRTLRNRLSIVDQVCRFAVERGWLESAPLRPRLPAKAAPVFRWITEAMFRRLRLAVFPPGTPTTIANPELVARRRVYLSWLFYTGVHTADADALNADQLFLDGQAYIRHNSKSARCVDDEQFEMPERLYLDLRELEDFLGRPFFPAEQIGGGAWPHVARVMGAAAKRLTFPHGANPQVLRRSFAREMYLRGYSVREVADRMGHADERMLHEIYVRTPRPAGHPKTRWAASPEPTPTGKVDSGMARVLKLPPAGGSS